MQFFFSTYERLIRDAPLKAPSLKDPKNTTKGAFFPRLSGRAAKRATAIAAQDLPAPNSAAFFLPFQTRSLEVRQRRQHRPSIHSVALPLRPKKDPSFSPLLRRRQHTNPIFIACFAFWAFFSHAHLRMRKKNFPSKQSVAGGRREEKKRCPLLR